MDNFNSVIDRALSEHKGSCLMNKKENGKYSLFLPITNLGELGSTAETIDKTVVGNMASSSISGRKGSTQQALTFFIHRDNLRILDKYKGTVQEFLRVLPDFSGFKYSGEVDYKVNDTGLGSAEQGEVSITITMPEERVDNCYDLVEDTAIFTSDVPEMIEIEGTGTKVINVTTNPGDATITATSETAGVATANYSEGKVTITGVTEGSAIIKLTATKTNYASFDRTIMVIVK